ncbi:MAG: lysylphosphatidylglycerol synthase domain-containing protein [Pseudomonadota bacterium]
MRWLPIVAALVVLAVLYAVIDLGEMGRVLAGTSWSILAWAIALLVGLVAISGLRLAALARVAGYALPGRVAIEATLAANALNLFVPGKLGDVLKAALMADPGGGTTGRATVLVAWEKLADLASLLLLAGLVLLSRQPDAVAGWALSGLGMALVGLLLWPGAMAWAARITPRMAPIAEGWRDIVAMLRGRPGGLTVVLAITLGLWAGHLAQISLMALALGVTGDAALWAQVAAGATLAIVVGLVPITIAGLGTRDAALVLFMGPIIGTGTAAALGVLFILRYAVPALIGAPLLPRLLGALSAHARKQFRWPRRAPD